MWNREYACLTVDLPFCSYNLFVVCSLFNVILLLSQSGLTPLLCASSGGHTDIVRLLLERGANTEVQDEEVSKSDEERVRACSVCGEC